METTPPANRKRAYRGAVAPLLLFLIGSVALVGCGDSVVIPLQADRRDADTHNREYFVYAVENLDQLSEFGPHEILGKIVSRLNQWGKADTPQSNWQLDPLIATLPESIQNDNFLENLSDSQYSPYDGVFLREAVMLRNVSKHVSRQATNNLETAEKLFDWTVANIALDPEPAEVNDPGKVQMPWHTMLFGHGRAIDRAWVFALLARQQNLDVVLLYVPDGKRMRLWCAGLVEDGQIYLFDPNYGVPIPGPTPGSIATLEQVADDESLLRQLDRNGAPYPFKADDVAEVDVYIEGSRQYLSERMKHIQSRLTGDRRLILSEQPSLLAEKVNGLPHTTRPQLWPWPFVAEQLLSEPNTPSRAAVAQEIKQYGKFVTGSVNPLWAGRMQQFAGNYTTQLAGTPRRPHDAPIGEQGAKPWFLKARTMLQRIPEDDLPQETRDRIEEVYAQADLIRRDGSYWLAMIAMDEEDYDLADYYLQETGKLQASPQWPGGFQRRGIHIALGRALEAAGKPAEAVSHYLAVRGPATAEAQYRAARLAQAAGKPLSSYSPAKDPAAPEPAAQRNRGKASAGNQKTPPTDAGKNERPDRERGDKTK